LKELKESRALVFATTHLADIKGFVHRSEGMLNASMEFDNKTFFPLYKLRLGEPGQSHALETARRYGLPESVIDSAKAMLGGIKVEFDNLIADLHQKRAGYEQALEELKKQKSEMDEKKMLLDQRLAETEKNSKELLTNAYKDASGIVLDMKRQMNALLEELKRKDKAERRAVVRKVEAVQKNVEERVREFDREDTGAPSIEEIKEGDTVFVRSLGYDASVVKVMKAHGRLKVRTGGMEIELPFSDIGFKRGKVPEAAAAVTKQKLSDEAAPSRINLLGLRVDEALSRLEPFLNHASLAGLIEVTVIHGLGTGILSKAVREHLDGHPLVKKYRTGERSEGGAGVTVVTLA
jgi:DNA mismatch repair protein MutS2